MKKFKIGDKVVPKSKTATSYGRTFHDCLSTSTTWKNAKERNQPYLYIIQIRENGIYSCDENEDSFSGDRYHESDLELYTEDVIVKQIVVNKPAVVVTLSNGEIGFSVCNPEDEFNEEFGIALATARAFGDKEKAKDLIREKDNNQIVKVFGRKIEVCDEKAKSVLDHIRHLKENEKSPMAEKLIVSYLRGVYALEEGTITLNLNRLQKDRFTFWVFPIKRPNEIGEVMVKLKDGKVYIEMTKEEFNKRKL